MLARIVDGGRKLAHQQVGIPDFPQESPVPALRPHLSGEIDCVGHRGSQLRETVCGNDRQRGLNQFARVDCLWDRLGHGVTVNQSVSSTDDSPVGLACLPAATVIHRRRSDCEQVFVSVDCSLRFTPFTSCSIAGSFPPPA